MHFRQKSGKACELRPTPITRTVTRQNQLDWHNYRTEQDTGGKADSRNIRLAYEDKSTHEHATVIKMLQHLALSSLTMGNRWEEMTILTVKYMCWKAFEIDAVELY